MQPDPFFVRRVAILGAGVMGTQLASHFANAGIQTILFDLLTKGGLDPNALVHQSLKALNHLHPSPLASPHLVNSIIPANYEEDLAKLTDCDLIIEAISERLAWKTDLYRKISPFFTEKTVFVSNTSGLSIQELSEVLPPLQRKQFCGMHFFNPPRYMKLVELIPHATTDKVLLEKLETFLVSHLGKSVIYAKDTPNFIGNRIGVFSILSTVYHADHFSLPADRVDALTGPLIGRSKAATFRTLDVVGLDTFSQVVETMEEGLKNDPWSFLFKTPAWLRQLIEKGALGQKTKMGIYKKQKEIIQVLDFRGGDYRLAVQKVSSEIEDIFRKSTPIAQFERLRSKATPEAKFLSHIFRDLFHYSAYHLASIAETVREVDLAVRLGYGWEQGPFELWQSWGWAKVAEWIQQEIEAKQTLSSAPLPEWVFKLGNQGVYRKGDAFSPEKESYIGQPELPVYKKQLFPIRLMGNSFDEGKTIFETQDVRMWTLKDDIPILNFKTKHNTITEGVLEGLLEALDRAEQSFSALVLWQREGQDFSFGVDLKWVLEAVQNRQINTLETVLKKFQQTALALRYATVPTIAAVRGMILGGGCELMMHCTRVVAALESYPGLVELGVGLIPAGAGCKEMALRATRNARGEDPFSFLQFYFNTIAKTEIAKSAIDAKRIGFLRETDLIVMNPQEILYLAKEQAKTLADSNYQAPLKEKIIAQGRSGWATLQVGLVNLREGKFISEYDYQLGVSLAKVMCGGEVEGGTEVPETWILALEQQYFMALIQNQKTQERIRYLLENGRPLRN